MSTYTATIRWQLGDGDFAEIVALSRTPDRSRVGRNWHHAEIVDGHGVRVREPCRRTRLTSETMGRIRLSRQLLPNDLDGDDTVHQGMTGLVDESHASFTKGFEEDVAPQSELVRRLATKAVGMSATPHSTDHSGFDHADCPQLDTHRAARNGIRTEYL